MSFKCFQCCSYRFGRLRGKVCLLNVFSAVFSYRFGRLRGKVCLLNVFSAAATGLDD